MKTGWTGFILFCFGLILLFYGFELNYDFIASFGPFIFLSIIFIVVGCIFVHVGTADHSSGSLKRAVHFLKGNNVYEVIGVVPFDGRFLVFIKHQNGDIRARKFDQKPPNIFKLVDGEIVEYPLSKEKEYDASARVA